MQLRVKKEPNWDRTAQRPYQMTLVILFPERQEPVHLDLCVEWSSETGLACGVDHMCVLLARDTRDRHSRYTSQVACLW